MPLLTNSSAGLVKGRLLSEQAIGINNLMTFLIVIAVGFNMDVYIRFLTKYLKSLKKQKTKKLGHLSVPPNWTPGATFHLIQIPPPKLPPSACFKFTISRGFLAPYHSSSVLRRNDNSPWSDRCSPISSKTWAILSTNLLLALWKYLMASRGPILQEGLMNLSWGEMIGLSLNAWGTQRVCYFTSFQVSPTCFSSESVHTGPKSHRVLELGENENFWSSSHQSFNHSVVYVFIQRFLSASSFPDLDPGSKHAASCPQVFNRTWTKTSLKLANMRVPSISCWNPH